MRDKLCFMSLFFTLLVGMVLSDCNTDIKNMFHPPFPNATYPDRLQMIDYTGKSINDMGNYDQCLALPSDIANYCLLSTLVRSGLVNIPVPIYLGLCVPASCTGEELTGGFTDTLLPLLRLEFPELNEINWAETEIGFYCHNKQYEKLSGPAIVTIALISLIGLLMFVGSILEGLAQSRRPKEVKKPVTASANLYVSIPQETTQSLPQIGQNVSSINSDDPPKRESRFIIFLKCFAVQTNTKWLLQDNTQNGESPLACLNGLRVLMMAWIILGHSVTYMVTPFGFDNDLEASKMVKQRSYQVIPGAEFSVDVFFYISGFLVMYMLLKELNQRHGKVSWGLFYFHRYWRLTPVYGYIMLIYTTITPYMIRGPFEYLYRTEKTDLCVQHWWTNFLYINNFWPKSSGAQCMGWSWYLANDMQFYVLTPFIAILWRKNRTAGWVALILLFIGALEAAWVITDHYKLVAIDGDNDLYNSVLYNKPYTRCVPYLQGIAVAFLLQYEGLDLTSNRIVRYIGYIISFGLTFSPIYLAASIWTAPWPQIENLMYNTFSRPAFVLGVSFVMYAMHKRHAFFFRKALSAPFWVSLARLTYTAYLLQSIVIFVQYFNTTTVFHLSPFSVTQHFATNLAISYLLGFFFYLAVEKPSANLERLFLPHK